MDAETAAEGIEWMGTDRPPRRQPWFRRVPGTGLAIVAVVALITSMNTTTRYLVSLPFDEWLNWFLSDLLFHMIIGTSVLMAAVWARNRVPQPGPSQYVAAFAAVTLAVAAARLAIEWASEGHGAFGSDAGWWHTVLWLSTDLLRYTSVGLVITSAWLYVRSEDDHAVALEQCALESARMDQQTEEARMQMLEAQIEPHFLFNTLAHVKRLYEIDRASGARMMANLKEYLAVALPQMRATGSTLGREIDHVTAYLNIQQIRMGRRLAFAIDVPDALRDARMPPLMLLTLVENAIKHGLGPLPQGGRIDVRAWSEGARLGIVVADTGQGFVKTGGGGTGLANIRARLASQFGTVASLSLALNAPRGIVATIVLPKQGAGLARGDA
jgi:hypothetical protein